MIFVDSNVPMYLTGSPHPHKLDAQRLVESAISERQKLVTSAEVLQEINHRFSAIDRRDAIQPVYDVLLGFVDDVLSVEPADAHQAKELILRYAGISSRDALHVAVMQRIGTSRIMTFDTGFDTIAAVQRIG